MKQKQPPAYYKTLLEQHQAEFDELDKQIREAVKGFADLSVNEVQLLGAGLKSKTDRVAVLRREMAMCKRELVKR